MSPHSKKSFFQVFWNLCAVFSLMAAFYIFGMGGLNNFFDLNLAVKFRGMTPIIPPKEWGGILLSALFFVVLTFVFGVFSRFNDFLSFCKIHPLKAFTLFAFLIGGTWLGVHGFKLYLLGGVEFMMVEDDDSKKLSEWVYKNHPDGGCFIQKPGTR
ncbi:MAG TPA: hypothetical protein DDW49_02700 [Deltaproteobacteria bacterium]|nr:MAG: hypothetical protein A2048_00705 [Deltaproteobacteria bacterium GWA2_45_12]HBF12288.1 hypothetical protein [Deltaproteobacteria bacterium]